MHKWEKVEADMRRSVLEPRPLLHRCVKCSIYRATYRVEENPVQHPPKYHWKTFYGQPYKSMERKAPSCNSSSTSP